MKRSAVGAVAAQGAQALASFALQVLVAHTLGIAGLGAFAILYGVVVLASGTTTGFVGDSLVVLDRRDPTIRSALQQYAVVFAFGSGALAAVVTTVIGLTTPVQALLFLLAVAAFCLEEVVRRLLMADLLFWRVTVIDSIGLVVALAIVGARALTGPLTLGVFLTALALGQTVALVAGMAVMPKHERFLVAFRRGGRGQVAAYGVWRSLQQFLRPALLTGVRTAVGIAAGLAATGLLEAGRTYVAPALLLVSGLSSYLFSTFARQRDADARRRLRRADTAVVAMLGLTVVIGIAAVVALPVAGPLLFSTSPDLRAVLGWLLYAASVAAVTPYGALAAVSGGQAAVFGIRLADTLVSLALVVGALLLGADPAWSAALLAVGSLAGGLALRFRAAGIAHGGGSRKPARRLGAAVVAAVVLLAVVGGGAAALLRTGTPFAPAPTASAAGRTVAIVGDRLVADSTSLRTALQRRLDRPVRVLAGPGSGYTGRRGAPTLAALAERVPAGCGTVVLVGGAADAGTPPLRLARGAAAAITAAHDRAPGAAVVLVGPVSGAPALDGVRDVLASAAEAGGARYVDPAAEGWFDTADVDRSRDRLTTAGRDELTRRLAALAEEPATP